MLDNNKSSEVSESTQTNSTSSSPLFDTTSSVTIKTPDDPPQLWRMRWFFAKLFAAALLLSILASIIIVVITKNPLPALVPTPPLLLSMRPLIRWLYPQEQYSKKQVS
jgi:hypothetical protein